MFREQSNQIDRGQLQRHINYQPIWRIRSRWHQLTGREPQDLNFMMWKCKDPTTHSAPYQTILDVPKNILSFSLNKMRRMILQHLLNFKFCLQVKRTWCAVMSACYDSTWKPVRRLTAPNTQVSLTVLAVSSPRLIIQILEVMDGSSKFRSDIMKLEQYLKCQDMTREVSVYS